VADILASFLLKMSTRHSRFSCELLLVLYTQDWIARRGFRMCFCRHQVQWRGVRHWLTHPHTHYTHTHKECAPAITKRSVVVYGVSLSLSLSLSRCLFFSLVLCLSPSLSFTLSLSLSLSVFLFLFLGLFCSLCVVCVCAVTKRSGAVCGDSLSPSRSHSVSIPPFLSLSLSFSRVYLPSPSAAVRCCSQASCIRHRLIHSHTHIHTHVHTHTHTHKMCTCRHQARWRGVWSRASCIRHR